MNPRLVLPLGLLAGVGALTVFGLSSALVVRAVDPGPSVEAPRTVGSPDLPPGVHRTTAAQVDLQALHTPPAAAPVPTGLAHASGLPWPDAVSVALAKAAGKAVVGGHEADIAPGAGWRLDLHQDDGTTLTRALVDLDRDGAWDLRVGFGATQPTTLQQATADDGTYDRFWVWLDGRWTPQEDHHAGHAALRRTTVDVSQLDDPLDITVLTWAGRDLGALVKPDVSAGQPFRVQVHQDHGATHATRALVDLDRDGTWDQWIVFGPEITRTTVDPDHAPGAPTARWNGTAWTRAE